MATWNITAILFFLSTATMFAQDHWQTWYEKSGGLETPRYDETRRYCRMLADSSDMISFLEYGKSPQGRSLFALILDRDGLRNPDLIREKGRIIFMVEACVHPGEPDGKDAGLLFLRNLAVYGLDKELLENVSVLFIPIVNPDGHERFGPYNRINQNGPKEMGWRTTATNLNLNRDFLKADAPEMDAWLELFDAWLPDFFMDIHTTNGADYQYVITYIIENFGNMDAGLTDWMDNQYIPFVEEELEKMGYPVFPYVTFTRWHDPRSGLRSRPSPPRFSQGYVAARNRAGILVETHMLKPYSTRVEATLELIRKTMKLLNHQKDNLMRLNSAADQLCTSGELLKEQFPLSFRLTDTSIPVEFRGFKYRVIESNLTGNDWFIYSDTPHTFTLDYYKHNVPERSANLPEAYIIPAEWSDIISRLALHGIEMQIFERDTVMEISTYKFSDVKFSPQPFEGRMMVQDFNMEEITLQAHLHAGSAYISTRQQAARIIAHALEPGSPDSFLQWGFLNTIFERKEYVESYVMEKMAREMIAENPSLLGEFEAFNATIPDSPAKMWAQYDWFHSRTPYYDNRKDVYPIGRVF